MKADIVQMKALKMMMRFHSYQRNTQLAKNVPTTMYFAYRYMAM
jgi:hypothetical protein